MNKIEKTARGPRPPIVVAHPTRQHSHHLAAALDGAGMLQIYLTIIPTLETLERWTFVGKRLVGSRLGPVDIERNHIRCWMSPWALKRGLDKLVARGHTTEICAYAIFDLWVASLIPRLRPSIVVGYEMACTASFEKAKLHGATCVLDAPAFASKLQDQLLESEKRRALTAIGRWVRRRKSAEIDLADVIICCSDMAAHSYLEAGVPSDRVIVNPLGCEVSLFSAPARSSAGAPKFCFVGTASETKGFKNLLLSFNRHRAENPDSELHIVGDERAARNFGATDGQAGVTLHGKKNHAILARLLAGMDALILPSVLDLFGMVVPEALAAGLYVILSDRVGAGMMVADERIGSIVPAGDKSALTLAMGCTAREIALVRKNADLRRSVAHAHDWAHYRKRSIKIFQSILIGERPSGLPRHYSARVISREPHDRVQPYGLGGLRDGIP